MLPMYSGEEVKMASVAYNNLQGLLEVNACVYTTHINVIV